MGRFVFVLFCFSFSKSLFLFCFLFILLYFYFIHFFFFFHLCENTPSEPSPAGAVQPTSETERSPSEQLKPTKCTQETGEKPREVKAVGERPHEEKLRPPEEKLWRKRPWEGFVGTKGRGVSPRPGTVRHGPSAADGRGKVKPGPIPEP